jgi:hypothetical protein
MDVAYLKKRLDYNPETGEFIWKPKTVRSTDDKRWNAWFPGQVAGTMDGRGYRRIMLDGKSYGAARLAWLYVYGEWPKNEIDHINRLRDDDRLVNLRDVTSSENCNNRSNNNGLPEGVQFNTKSAKYHSKIPKGVPVFGNIYLGQYVDPIVAGEVVQQGIEIILDNEDEETIKRLLKELKDARTEILSEAERRKSGLPKGISKKGNGFQAQIWRNEKYVYLGTFGTLEEASEVYQQAALKHKEEL